MLRSLSILLACQLAGEGLAALFGWPIPGPVLGMLLLLAGLMLRGAVPDDFAADSHGLLKYLPLVLIPPSVAVMDHGHSLRDNALAIGAVIVLSTMLSLLVAGLLFSRLTGKR